MHLKVWNVIRFPAATGNYGSFHLPLAAVLYRLLINSLISALIILAVSRHITLGTRVSL